MPSSLQARITRSAISPRLAIKTFSNMRTRDSARPAVAPYHVLTDFEQRLAKLNRLTIVSEHFGNNAAGFCLNLVHHFHCFDDANNGVFGDGFPDFNKRRRVG